MAIETRIQPRQTIQNLAYGVICLVLAVWGWYDYSVKIPAAEAAFREYTAAAERKGVLENTTKERVLNEAERGEYNAVQATLAKYKEKPAEPAAYDRPVQLWLYIVGCGVLGVPWFAYAQWQLSRARFRLGDDGSFECNFGTFQAGQIRGIKMDKWMLKSIAVVQLDGGMEVVLDDYKYKGVEEIVAHFAGRFEPGKWTSDARPIGDPKSRDTKARLAAEAAARAAGDEGGQGSDNAPTA